MLNKLTDLLGVESQSVSHKERLISGIGAFLGIFFVYFASQYFVGDQGLIFILASMGHLPYYCLQCLMVRCHSHGR